MRLTVLGGSGAFPPPGGACSGYVVEQEGFRLLVDPGYATLPRLPCAPAEVDAVLVTHAHPDHCADLNPLLRARVLPRTGVPPLPVWSLPGALDAVLALEPGPMLDGSYVLHDLAPVAVGPFDVVPVEVPHFVPCAGVRLTAGGRTLAYPGDSRPDPAVVRLATGADLFLAEASFPAEVPEAQRAGLTSAVDASRQATWAGVGRLVLTHVMPVTSPDEVLAAAEFDGPVDVAVPGLTIDL
jgi:ribonuclease BN (tRNA processing enzyme)